MQFPLEYSKLYKYFDPSPNSTNRSITKILKHYKVKTVLDLTCGTGSQVFWLAKRGFKVTGADISPNLLKVARSTARKERVNIKFLQGDMRTIKVGNFDAAITIFNAIGHLTKTGLKKAMQNIHKNLNNGGLYIFDIFNLDGMTDRFVNTLGVNEKKTIGNIKFQHNQYSKLDKKKGVLWSYDDFFIQKDSNKPQKYKGKFSLQLYTAKELKTMLTRNGFKVLRQYEIDGSKFSAKRSKEILTIAKKLP